MAEAQIPAENALWHGQAHMPSVMRDPLIIVSGDGAYVETADGRRLLDATASLWHANIGHGRERLADAARRQMLELETYHTFGATANLPAIQLAGRVARMAPVEDPKIIWTSGGSDAVDAAAKLVRRFWQHEGEVGKRIIISREGSYHGLHAYGTSLAGLDFNRAGYGSESLVPETARVPTNDAEALAATIAELGRDRVAAFYAEPVLGTGGVIAPAPGYLESAGAICRENDVLFVVDEVITGFGRLGTMFASERFNLEPDLMLVAKGITSGYAPLGGVIVAPRVWRPFFEGDDAPIFRHGITYSGHATACAVAAANIDVLEEEALVARVAGLEPVLENALAPLADHPLVKELRSGVGLLAGVQLDPDVPGPEVVAHCLEAGVLVRVITDNTVQISPPFVVTEAELDKIGAVLFDALEHVDPRVQTSAA
jgi:adenosylmethionine-8-amino-7-oxononanoate aminotransferase